MEGRVAEQGQSKENPTNAELYRAALRCSPGGVQSPVRAFSGMGRDPIFIEKALGAYLYGASGEKFLDFCMSFGPLILGHCHPTVEQALHQALQRGWTYGAPSSHGLMLAQEIIARIPAVDKVRFVNSGTEAVMTALRIARGATGRAKILKFQSCYHGHCDPMLVKAGSGLSDANGGASSLGIPAKTIEDTLIIPLDDSEALEKCFQKWGSEIAAAIIEPLPANYGLWPLPKSFLKRLRELTTAHGSLLIFDEVISGFRLAPGALAQKLDITPDLITLGKVIGGGFPVGAIAGANQWMDLLAPLGGVYQAGTLSGNPVAMVAGLTTLSLMDDEQYRVLENYSRAVVDIFQQWFDQGPLQMTQDLEMVRAGSLFWIVPKDPSRQRRKVGQVPTEWAQQFPALYHHLLAKGIYLSPHAYEVGFVSLAHDSSVQEDLKKRLWS